MKRYFICLLFAVCFSGVYSQEDLSQYIDPMIGTAGHGHTFPGATLPFGLVQLSPDNDQKGWDWCSGYHYSDSTLLGFSHTHLSGTGVGDLLDIRIMPTTYQPKSDTAHEGRYFIRQFKDYYKHENEIAKAGYYAVTTKNSKIKCELTATMRSGFHRYLFPQGDNASIVLDLAHDVNNDKTEWSHIKISDTLVTGYRKSKGWARNQIVYFAIKFSKPIRNYSYMVDGWLKSDKELIRGKRTCAIFSFTNYPQQELLVKVGISYVSSENALMNLNTEINHWDFEKTKNDANLLWNKEMKRIKIETTDVSKKRTFYTAIYHTMCAPQLYSDVNGDYRAEDFSVKKTNGFEYYSTLSLWDTFRAANPLYSMIIPSKVSQFIKGMLAHYDDFGLLPFWTLTGQETWCMIGYHSIPVIVDAYMKGIRDFDVPKSYKAMLNSANFDHQHLKEYKKFGYIPCDIEEYQSVSRTLEYAYNDWCISLISNEMKKEEESKLYKQRSLFYQNVFDTKAGFMRPKTSNGEWTKDFTPLRARHYAFTEGNAWQYSWFVPHDVYNLIKLHGGNEKFVLKLDTLFNMSPEIPGEKVIDMSGFIGQYVHGNEPSHHIAYLYNYAGMPWKTQERLSQIVPTMYSDKPDGLCGNEDCGQMSAWYIYSVLGFYPVNPASGIYVIGAPFVDKATLSLENGKTFVVEAKNLSSTNKYIQSVTLNGVALTNTSINHSDIMNGGILSFVMGNKPNKRWGVIPGTYPKESAYNLK